MPTHAVIVIELDVEDDAPVNVMAQVVDPISARLRDGITGAVPRQIHLAINEVADSVMACFTPPHT